MRRLEDISRREFFESVLGIGIVGISCLVGGACITEAIRYAVNQYRLKTIETHVPLEELSSHPEKYNKRRVKTDGFLEYTGKESYLVNRREGGVIAPFAGMSPLSGVGLIEPPYYSKGEVYTLEIDLPSYRLHTQPNEKSPSFLVTEAKPYKHLSVAEEVTPGTFYQNKIQLTGIVYNDNNNKYFLQVLKSPLILDPQ